MSKAFSKMLIDRGIYSGRKNYSKVRPKGIYLLSPSAWRKAKVLQDSTDLSYEILMNQYYIATKKIKLSDNHNHNETKDK